MGGIQFNLYRPRAFVEHENHCGCALPEGGWGDQGFHWQKADQPFLYRNEQKRFAQDRQGWSREQLRQAWHEWVEGEARAGRMGGDGVHQTWRPYLGLPFAMEPCPAYRAKVRTAMDQQTTKRQSERRGKRLLGEEET